LNGNGNRDGGEPNLAGFVVNLQNSSGGTIAVAISDAFGAYQFANLPFGSYRVQAATPAGWYATTPTIVAINLFGCGAFIGLDFGFNQATPTPNVTNTATNTPVIIVVTFTPTSPPPPTATPSFTPIIIIVTPTPTNTPTITPTPTNSPSPTPLPSVNQITSSIAIPALGTGSTTANCPGGMRISGGGFSHNGALEVYVSTLSGNGWLGTARNTLGSPVTLNVYALCLSNLSGTTNGVPQSTNIAAASTGQVTSNCPGGQFLTGGGYSTVANMEVYNDSPQGNGWLASARNNNGSPQTLFSVAVCYNGTATSSIATLPVTVPASTNGTATIACPSGLVTGGGYLADVGLKVYNSSQLSNGWEVSANNTTGGPKTLTVNAVCVGF
jgi:hypothetical protein